MTKKQREQIRQKFGGLCAYSGTPLEDDWQADHVEPLVRDGFGSKHCLFPENDTMDNLVPCQRVINKYKGTLTLNEFRNWYLGGLHERLRKLPKNPTSENSIRRKAFLLRVASYFNITEDAPFSGTFYFEQLR